RTAFYEERGAIDAKLAETVTAYDEANRVCQTERLALKADLTTPIGDGWQTRTFWRDELGRVLESSGDVCGCSASAYVYDGAGRMVTVKDALPAGQQNLRISEYDRAGNVTRTLSVEKSQDTGIVADKTIETLFVFDARDRLVTKCLRSRCRCSNAIAAHL